MNGSNLLPSSPFLWCLFGRSLPVLFSPFLTLVALFFLTMMGSATSFAAQELGLITNVRTLTTDDATRVILHLSQPIRYQLTTEPPSSDQRLDAPLLALHITFSSATLAPNIPLTLRVDDALLRSVRSRQTSTATVRISLELTGIGITYRALDLRSPYQVVIVLRKVAPRPRQEPETQR
jgi:hypothetical protein